MKEKIIFTDNKIHFLLLLTLILLFVSHSVWNFTIIGDWNLYLFVQQPFRRKSINIINRKCSHLFLFGSVSGIRFGRVKLTEQQGRHGGIRVLFVLSLFASNNNVIGTMEPRSLSAAVILSGMGWYGMGYVAVVNGMSREVIDFIFIYLLVHFWRWRYMCGFNFVGRQYRFIGLFHFSSGKFSMILSLFNSSIRGKIIYMYMIH